VENIHNIVMSLQKKGRRGGERGGMLSWLQPFFGGGRFVIHVMDSPDSLAAAAERKPPLCAEAKQRHRPSRGVNTGRAQRGLRGLPAHQGPGWGLGVDPRPQMLSTPFGCS